MYLCWCRSAGKFRKARPVCGSILAVIPLIALKYSQVFGQGKFEKKNWASGNYVLPRLENRHCAFKLV